MSETSEEIPMPVPPQENPPPGPNYSFYLKMKPFRTLKLAIEALIDPTFKNDHQFGLFVAATERLVISAKNENKNATAALSLKSSGMIEFRASPLPRIGLWAPLRFISQGFPRNLDGDDDTVVISHVHGTKRLHFEFGTVPPTGFWAEIVEIPNAKIFPCFTIFTATTVPVNDIREMIDCTLQQTRDLGNDIVSIDWKKDIAAFKIGSDKKWEYDYSENEVQEPTGLINGLTYEAQFNWSYTRLLKQACSLADEVGVKFLTFPRQHVLFQFRIGEIADLVLMKKAVLVVVPADMNTEADARA